MDAPLPFAPAVRLDHPALLYRSLDEFVDSLVPYVAEGVENGELVFVAARGDYLPAVRRELGELAGSVRWADTARWHAHPSTRLRAFHRLVVSGLEGGTHAFRLAGEPVWPAGPPELIREWQRYESVLNAVLDPYPVRLLCLYDASVLDPAILESARCTHRRVQRDGLESSSELYEEPAALLSLWNPQPAPPPSSASGLWVSRLADLPAARELVTARGLGAGLPPERVADLSVATTEVLSNALLHGGGEARLWIWAEDGRLVCQVRDTGTGLVDPLAGYRPPAAGESGRGLWVARQLVDLLQIVGSAEGTTVRLVTSG